MHTKLTILIALLLLVSPNVFAADAEETQAQDAEPSAEADDGGGVWHWWRDDTEGGYEATTTPLIGGELGVAERRTFLERGGGITAAIHARTLCRHDSESDIVGTRLGEVML